jgi:hypothetical protein
MTTHTPSHGRYAEGCRCKGCTQANRDYMRWYRKNSHLIKRTARESQLAPGKLSIRPLLAAIDHIDDATTAERIGVDRMTVVRWKREGLNLRAADKAACKLGYHPYLIWGNEYWHAK